jgi:hypothetical protein
MALAASCLLVGLLPCSAADWLKWDTARDQVDANVETWTVPQMLGRVAAATGWEIYLDPEITDRVPTKFTGKQQGDALRRLLGDYNYALVPSTNAQSRFFVFRNSRAQATRAIDPVVAKATTNRIGNELIVTLKPGEKIEDIAKRLGAKVVGRSDGQNTYRLRFDDDKSADTARTSLESDSAVESVDSNYYVSRPDTTQALGTAGPPIGLNPKLSPDGKYTIVGMIDSAMQPKQGGFESFLAQGAPVEETLGSSPSHGTSMAATLLRALAAVSDDKSTSVRLYPANVFGPDGESTTTFDIATGIFKTAEGGATIFNLPLGGEGNSSFLHNTIKSLYEQGALFVAAAGNSPVTTPTYPAAYPEVIAVTAINRQGELAPYANRGSFIDTAAPGDSFITFNGQRYHVIGTSASTSYVSGLAAYIAETKKLSGKALQSAVLQTLSGKK